MASPRDGTKSLDEANREIGAPGGLADGQRDLAMEHAYCKLAFGFVDDANTEIGVPRRLADFGRD
jgi:hypothetical protein